MFAAEVLHDESEVGEVLVEILDGLLKLWCEFASTLLLYFYVQRSPILPSMNFILGTW